MAQQIHAEAVKMVAHAKAFHIGDTLSLTDLLVVLFVAATVHQ